MLEYSLTCAGTVEAVSTAVSAASESEGFAFSGEESPVTILERADIATVGSGLQRFIVMHRVPVSLSDNRIGRYKQGGGTMSQNYFSENGTRTVRRHGYGAASAM